MPFFEVEWTLSVLQLVTRGVITKEFGVSIVWNMLKNIQHYSIKEATFSKIPLGGRFDAMRQDAIQDGKGFASCEPGQHAVNQDAGPNKCTCQTST